MKLAIYRFFVLILWMELAYFSFYKDLFWGFIFLTFTAVYMMHREGWGKWR